MRPMLLLALLSLTQGCCIAELEGYIYAGKLLGAM